MLGALCHYSHQFPKKVSNLLGFEEQKRLAGTPLSRRFREETLTDILMGGLLPFHPRLIRHIDFAPNEKVTGHDIEWEFVHLLPDGGSRYLRLHLQAKRAAPSKGGRVWRYKELDYRGGQQAQDLVAEARKIGRHCVPLYLLYHPQQILKPWSKKLPAIEGVNIMLTPPVARAVNRGCNFKVRRVDYWQKHFMPLSKLLCLPQTGSSRPAPLVQFVTGGPRFLTSQSFPDVLASSLEEHRKALRDLRVDLGSFLVDEPIEATEDVPFETMRLISGEFEQPDTFDGASRSRAIFVSGGRKDVRR